MTTVPAAVWFLSSNHGQSLGQVYRSSEDAVPTVGDQLTNGSTWKTAEVVEFSELAATCAMRRFRVVIRVMD